MGKSLEQTSVVAKKPKNCKLYRIGEVVTDCYYYPAIDKCLCRYYANVSFITIRSFHFIFYSTASKMLRILYGLLCSPFINVTYLGRYLAFKLYQIKNK